MWTKKGESSATLHEHIVLLWAKEFVPLYSQCKNGLKPIITIIILVHFLKGKKTAKKESLDPTQKPPGGYWHQTWDGIGKEIPTTYFHSSAHWGFFWLLMTITFFFINLITEIWGCGNITRMSNISHVQTSSLTQLSPALIWTWVNTPDIH